ncbi:MAG: ATP-dependent DNA helicase RecG [Candidatus Doudnabacteria bacterium]|nr:ATP-dependent DNA helicase RecG [Candidatus Doudnabacteria bacterium]
MHALTDSVTVLHLVTKPAEKALARLNIRTIEDLLYYFPRDWQDLSEIRTIADIRPNEKITIRARIKSLSGRRTWKKRLHLTEALLEDNSGNIVAVWFNQPFLKNSLQAGREYYFHGKSTLSPYGRSPVGGQLANPSFELVKDETIHTAAIVPVYDLTEGLTGKQLRYFLKQALEEVLPQLKELLPRGLREKLALPDLSVALHNIHFPKSKVNLAAARRRLAFDELFSFQLAFLSYKKKLQTIPAPPIRFQEKLIKNFVQSLPFALTASQKVATWEILKDIAQPHPMNRLLEGEVGSGKTVVAGIAMYEVAKAGLQSVLLAPTEILAWQHYETLKKLYKNTGLRVRILTRSHKETFPPHLSSPTSGEEVKEGVIVGTHALLEEGVEFEAIGLLVVDEQQRFGVKQRGTLQTRRKSQIPHLLTMTATPIPRTLALAFYGDLDISRLKELPSGRKKVLTKLVPPEKRTAAYNFLRKEIEKGRQVYVVVPLVGESPHLTSPTRGEEKNNNEFPPLDGEGKGGVKSAKLEQKKLQKIFPEFRIGLLHGRMPAKGGESKEQVMNSFRAGIIHILVSTTVIEVGVDVGNATIMLIENAERFGLAQLHQLRGRVGRSEHQSYCLLFSENPNEFTRTRLQAVVESTDGFALSERDLELRGPGEILGTRQAGFIPFKIARFSDRELIKLAKKEAEKFLEVDPKFSTSPALKTQVLALAKDAHLE